ncbi:hypothetical protein [Bradyrhizobium sp. sGM-13]|uniref:hypothetical protein n=1 Tax=Bradyrhizobium sp. sGM-13 TaxID=2831781 RepID=UPI001BCA8A04|nr:hypothetical protein [Bradyrhizobium sp. sGM-13]
MIRAKGVAIIIEHASDSIGQAFTDGIADEIVDLIEGPAQQRLARFAVASPVQDMKPAE